MTCLYTDLFVVARFPSSHPTRASSSEPVHADNTQVAFGANSVKNFSTAGWATSGRLPMPTKFGEYQLIVGRWAGIVKAYRRGRK